MVMRGYKEVSWKQAKAMMSEANFLKSLTEMDVDGITSTQVSLFRAKICDHDVCPQCCSDRHSLDHMSLHCPSTLAFSNYRKLLLISPGLIFEGLRATSS